MSTATLERRMTYGDSAVRRAVSATLDRMVLMKRGGGLLSDYVAVMALERVARRALGVGRQTEYGAALSNAVHDLQVAGHL